MFYIVANNTAYALDHSNDVPYKAPVLSNGMIDWDQSYDVNYEDLTEDEQEYVAHIFYHLQQVAQLTEEHNQTVFVK
jgi:hypothetical protein